MSERFADLWREVETQFQQLAKLEEIAEYTGGWQPVEPYHDLIGDNRVMYFGLSQAAADSIVVGRASRAGASGVLVVGDDTKCDGEGLTQVGTLLNGKLIPETVRAMIERNPEEIRWLIRRIAEMVR